MTNNRKSRADALLEGCLLVRFVRYLWNAVLDSRIYAFLYRIVAFFGAAYESSALRAHLAGGKTLEGTAAGQSKVYAFLARLVGVPVGLSRRIVTSLRPAFAGSIAGKAYHAVTRGLGFDRVYTLLTAFLAVFLFLVPHDYWANPFGLVFAALLLLLYLIACGAAQTKPGENSRGLWASFLFFGFCLAVSTLISYDVSDSVRVLSFFVTSFLLCLCVYAAARREEDLTVFFAFLYACLVFTAVIAVAQRLLGVEADASLTDLSLNADMPGRVFSTLGNPNNYAEFLVLFLPYGAAFVITRRSFAARLITLAGLLLGVGALFLTFSRSGWIAFAIALFVFVLLFDKRYLPVLFMAVLFALPLLPRNVLNRILTIGNMKDSSSSYRLDIWTGCLKMLKDYWFTGVGLGTGGFGKIYPPYAVGTSGVAPHSHMHFMEMLIELGFLGFISYVTLTFSLIRRSFAAASKAVPQTVRLAAIASASAMTGIVLIGCFEYCWFYPRVMFAFFLTAGLAMAAHRQARPYLGKKN